MNRTEASVRHTSQASGSSAARAQEAPGADDGRIQSWSVCGEIPELQW